jgi:methyltransferase (TIGR00027 family)
MMDNTPSRTALRVALRRGAHQIIDEPRIFDDPLALRIVGMEDEASRDSDPAWLEREREPLNSRLRAFLAVRSRFAEDQLHSAVKEGARQYVILGAGLDTFAYRHSYPGNALHVFEVDHPATQAWKKSLLEKAAIPVPESLTFAPVDFETMKLGEGLRQAGFDRDARTFFSWLGVTQYIDKGSVKETIAFVSALPAGSGIVFDYTMELALMSPSSRMAFERLSQLVAAAGEPFRTFFDPALLKEFLASLGFGRIEDIGPEELNTLYFHGRPDGLKTGGFTRIMSARV